MENLPEVFLKYSDSHNPIDRLDFLYQVSLDIAFHIDDVIGYVAFAFIDHVGDVELVFGQQARDFLDHAGLVLVRNGEPDLVRSV